MSQSKSFGKYLKNKYHSFLNTIYNRTEVHARSTDSDRTLQSSYALLAGLFPPGQSFQRFNQHLNWQPIPVHTTVKESDIVSFIIINDLSVVF